MGFLDSITSGLPKSLYESYFPNPADKANKEFNQIPGQVSPYYKPFFEAGQRQLPGLESQFGQLANDPSAFFNKIAGGYKQSPGYQFQLQQGTQAANNAAAAGGMGGTPQAQQGAAGVAENLANQDFYNWLKQVMGLEGMGLEGEMGIAKMGSGAGGDMAKMIADALSAQGSANFAGQTQENKGFGDIISKAIGAFI